jgi:hypothetical protein
MLSIQIAQKTFAPYEVFTFENSVSVPPLLTAPSFTIKAMSWDGLNKLLPATNPMEIKR